MKNRKKKVQCSKPAAPRCAWMPFEEDEIIGVTAPDARRGDRNVVPERADERRAPAQPDHERAHDDRRRRRADRRLGRVAARRAVLAPRFALRQLLTLRLLEVDDRAERSAREIGARPPKLPQILLALSVVVRQPHPHRRPRRPRETQPRCAE